MSQLSELAHLAAAGAGFAAGAVNALAGGGTLISFPVLTAIGVPSVSANATNTVALVPGYVGGTWAVREQVSRTAESLRARLIVAGAGGLSGAVLFVFTSNAAFRSVVPFLILMSCVLLAVQDPMRRWMNGRHGGRRLTAAELVGMYLAGAYGGFFGAGLGIMLIGVLGLFSGAPFTQLNAIKLPLSIVINLSAAALLAFSGRIEWTIALVIAPASLLGGAAGGRLSTRLPANRFKWFVVAVGVTTAIVYFIH